MKESLSANEALKLWVQLGQARDIIRKAIRKELEEHNVTVSQAGVLMVVQASETAITPAEISRQLFREPNTISVVLKRMEKQGLLNMTRNLGKKNHIGVTLTKKGEKKFFQTSKRKALSRIFSCLSAEEIQQLTSCLGKVKRRGMKELGMRRDTLFSP
jgi:DNA-binding MarR family transcriptional regulator